MCCFGARDQIVHTAECRHIWTSFWACLDQHCATFRCFCASHSLFIMFNWTFQLFYCVFNSTKVPLRYVLCFVQSNRPLTFQSPLQAKLHESNFKGVHPIARLRITFSMSSIWIKKHHDGSTAKPTHRIWMQMFDAMWINSPHNEFCLSIFFLSPSRLLNPSLSFYCQLTVQSTALQSGTGY